MSSGLLLLPAMKDGVSNWVKVPDGVMRPIAPAPSVNHRLPSGPVVIRLSDGRVAGTWYSVICAGGAAEAGAGVPKSISDPATRLAPNTRVRIDHPFPFQPSRE